MTALPIESEETIGRLLKRLNRICTKAVESGNHDKPQTAAAFSMTLERAIAFADEETMVPNPLLMTK